MHLPRQPARTVALERFVCWDSHLSNFILISDRRDEEKSYTFKTKRIVVLFLPFDMNIFVEERQHIRLDA